jgi:hypothetical protein
MGVSSSSLESVGKALRTYGVRACLAQLCTSGATQDGALEPRYTGVFKVLIIYVCMRLQDRQLTGSDTSRSI